MIRRGGALVAVLALAAPVSAEPAPIFELSVVRGEGAGSCPSGAEFERRVSTRLGRVPFTANAEQVIEATLTRREEGWRASITLRDASGVVRGQRELEASGTDCAPLAEATTLALALTIDPDAALAPPGTSEASPPEALAPPTSAAPPACPALACPRPSPCPACSAPRPASSLVMAGALHGALTGGMLPGAAPGVELTVEAGSSRVRGRLGLLYLPERSAEDPRFGFGLTTASAGACGAVSPLPALELALCADLQLGAIHAVVHELEPLEPGDQLWFAAAMGPRLRLQGPASVFVEIGVAAVVPILDRTFSVAGFDEPVFETSAFGANGVLGLGLRSP